MGYAGGHKEVMMVRRGMDQNILFSLALGLASPWKVVRSGLEDGGAESKVLHVDIEGGRKCHVRSARSSVHCMITR